MLLTIHGLCRYVSLHVHFAFLRTVWEKKNIVWSISSFYFGCHFNLPVVLQRTGEERSSLPLSLPFCVCSYTFSSPYMVVEVCVSTIACLNAVLPAKVARSKIPKEKVYFCCEENNRLLECNSFVLSSLLANK